MRFSIKDLARGACPPIAWNLLRRFKSRFKRKFAKAALRFDGIRVIRALPELDAYINHVESTLGIGHEAFQSTLMKMRYEHGMAMPSDPDSPEYNQAQAEVYRLLSGRTGYRPEVDEMIEKIDVAGGAERPFPYSTNSSRTVGEQLMGMGILIRVLEARAGHNILEFGFGWGNTTLELAKLGCIVEAVDINPQFVDLVQRRCQRLRLHNVTCVQQDMLKFSSNRRFDRVVFYECFHHCPDHEAMFRRFDDLVTPDGLVIFALEPISDTFEEPWGFRMDGLSVYCIRKFGWRELGFRVDYFVKRLASHGWIAELHQSKDVPHQQALVARRKPLAKPQAA